MPRLDVAVITQDGEAQVVNIGRPDTLVAFADAHDGKEMPDTAAELFWSAHHALGVAEPLVDWRRRLELCSMFSTDVALARRIIAGDEQARRIALGEEAPDDDFMARIEQAAVGAAMTEAGLAADGAARPPDPTPRRSRRTRGGPRSPA